MKLSLVARKALEAYLIVSADDGAGNHYRSVSTVVQVGHPHGRIVIVAADDDTVGMLTVMNGSALSQEFGIGHHGHVPSCQRPLDSVGRSDGDRGLVDHDRSMGQLRTDFPRDLQDGGHVS